MLTNEVPDASAGTADDRAPRRRTRRMVVIGTITAVFLAFCGLTARLFVFPASGMPAHVDAIVMMAGPGDRYAPIRAAMWPYELAYEWTATIKALTINRSC